MKPIVILLLIMLVLAGYDSVNAGQKPISTSLTALIDTSEYAEKVDVMPEISGGVESLLSKIKYPESAKEAKTEGCVYIRAFIDEKGNVADTKVEKSISADLDKAALDAVSKISFVPGKKDGKSIKTQIVIPIMFQLK